MTCALCSYAKNATTSMHNDCVIECLERIKAHYMSLTKKCSVNELLISKLQGKNNELEKVLSCYEQPGGKDSRKKPRTDYPEDHGSALQCSEIFENAIIDNFNNALNDEEEFEMSFAADSQKDKKDQIIANRLPMKAISLSPSTSNVSSPSKAKFIKSKTANVKKEKNFVENSENRKPKWNSKERSAFDFFRNDSSKFSRNIKQERKHPKLSLNSGRLRQTRLQLDTSKDLSNDNTTFCEEAIDASPVSDSTLKKCNSARQWLLRNKSNKINKSDSVFDVSSRCPLNTTKDASINPQEDHDASENSSVVMLTPATQDIIFLDDTCESFDMRSMDLLQNMVNPSESKLKNLRRIESDRIKLIQKTVSGNLEHQVKEDPSFSSTEILFTEANDMIKEEVNSEYLKDTLTDQISVQKISSVEPKMKLQEDEQLKRRLANVDCIDCQKYIKHLGYQMSDEEIERHIRNCTKHKKRIEINLTPAGFWDPSIKPFDINDPRNEILVDTRFIGKERRS